MNRAWVCRCWSDQLACKFQGTKSKDKAGQCKRGIQSSVVCLLDCLVLSYPCYPYFPKRPTYISSNASQCLDRKQEDSTLLSKNQSNYIYDQFCTISAFPEERAGCIALPWYMIYFYLSNSSYEEHDLDLPFKQDNFRMFIASLDGLKIYWRRYNWTILQMSDSMCVLFSIQNVVDNISSVHLRIETAFFRYNTKGEKTWWGIAGEDTKQIVIIWHEVSQNSTYYSFVYVFVCLLCLSNYSSLLYSIYMYYNLFIVRIPQKSNHFGQDQNRLAWSHVL